METLDLVAAHYGMALVNTHPDYLCRKGRSVMYEEFLDELADRSGYWHASPEDVAARTLDRWKGDTADWSGLASQRDGLAADDSRAISVEGPCGLDENEARGSICQGLPHQAAPRQKALAEPPAEPWRRMADDLPGEPAEARAVKDSRRIASIEARAGSRNGLARRCES